MLSAPRISGSLLKSLARLARTRAGSSALQLALRAELGINALQAFARRPRSERSRSTIVALLGSAAAKASKITRSASPKSGWSKIHRPISSRRTSRARTTPERILARVLERAARARAHDAVDARPRRRRRRRRARATPKPRAIAIASARRRVRSTACASSIKEQTRVRGLPAKGGTAYMDGAPQKKDATIVRRLSEAGAVIVGTTPMTEFGMTPLGFNPHRTMPRNPHDPGRTSRGLVDGLGRRGRDGSRSDRARRGRWRLDPHSFRAQRRLRNQADVGTRERAREICSAGSVAHLGPLASSTADLARVLEVIGAPDPRDPETARRAAAPSGLAHDARSDAACAVSRSASTRAEWADASPEVATRGARRARARSKKKARSSSRSSSPLMRHAPAIGYLAIAIETRAELATDWADHADACRPICKSRCRVVAEFGAVEFAEALRLRSGLRTEAARTSRRGRPARAPDAPFRPRRRSPTRNSRAGSWIAQALGWSVPLQLSRKPHGAPRAARCRSANTMRLPIGLQLARRRVGRSDGPRGERAPRTHRRRERIAPAHQRRRRGFLNQALP